MAIDGAAQFPHEEAEIIAFRKASKLGDIVQPDIEHLLDVCLPQRAEELSGVLLRETDRIDLEAYSRS
ncbi:MAG TPA: hypothetical protein VMV92_41080 [Streptosporangiaceae bacterium]|nr:hypothetical protein [Streptosporangiaceae bacterium]